MPDIRYVCLSDMHLGEEDSLLTNLKTASSEIDFAKPSPVLEQLVACLRKLIEQNEKPEKPALVLNGDILELALAETNEAAMVFERFIELIMPPGKELFQKIIYVPGNHDHHLWETARETQYVDYLAEIKPTSLLQKPWHATNLFLERTERSVPSFFLTRLVRRYDHLKNFTIETIYPNLGLMDEQKRKCIIFHHGHFVEPLYTLMTFLRTLIFADSKPPEEIWDLEEENFAWIDFFWSTMGRSGQAGRNIEMIYEKLHDKKQLKQLLHNLANNLAKKYDLPGWGDLMERKILEWAFDLLVDRFFSLERAYTEKALSPDTEKGLWKYMNLYVYNQIKTEVAQSKFEKMETTFVFGHTHKPFAEDMNFQNYSGWVNVYNTGGWVVETITPQPLHGGSVVLIDENLNAVSLRMYNQSEKVENYLVAVEEAARAGDKKNPLYDRIQKLVKPQQNPWKTFSLAVDRAVRVRAQNLRARINERV
jgi:UDP-2,3-diacylglucosamine pyrophosphatase LpxH